MNARGDRQMQCRKMGANIHDNGAAGKEETQHSTGYILGQKATTTTIPNLFWVARPGQGIPYNYK